MSDGPWFKFYASDWIGGTRLLSATVTGVYITLIAMIYDKGGPISNDEDELARACGLPPKQFQSALEKLVSKRKITVSSDGKLSNPRSEKELAARRANSSQRADAAKVRWQKTDENQASSDASASAPHDPRISTRARLQKSDLREDTSRRSVAASPRRTKATRLDAAWLLPSKWGEWAMTEFPHLTRDAIRREAEGFRDYWISKPDHATKLDWEATWRNWIRRAATQSQPRGSPRQSNRPPTMLELNTQLLAEMENADARRQEDHGQLEPPAGNLPAVWER